MTRRMTKLVCLELKDKEWGGVCTMTMVDKGPGAEQHGVPEVH